MSSMKQIILSILILCVASCTTIKNVSRTSDFSKELGQKELTKDVFICEIENDDRGMFERTLPKNKLFENHGFESCPYGKDVASIIKGAKVRIEEASYREHFGIVSYTDHWYLVGSTDFKGQEIHFYFDLGTTTDGLPPIAFKDKLLWD